MAAFEKTYQRTVLTRLPNDYRQVTEAVAMGTPLVGSTNNALLARYRELASWLLAGANAAAGSAQPLANAGA
ncbi:MAG TPA: hypothetical protein VNK23_07165 [Candidatus Dormibacteraeota bacterium]|nr:hypothetical protein [Candidatus Dormibacteraeota bacterium]